MAGSEGSVVCSKCAANLPQGTVFCPRCGHPAKTASKSAAPAAVDARCSLCGAELPEGSRFCLKCGRAVSPPPAFDANEESTLPFRQPRGKVGLVAWLLFPILLLCIGWAAMSDNPAALQFQRIFHRAHAETVAPAAFSVGARSFSYFKFEVPAAARDVAVTGKFSAQGGQANDIEVQLLTEDGFISWQDGYSANTFYNSGRVTQGEINAVLPSTAGTYYLVFNNKFSAKSGKAIQSDLTLNYQKWWPIL
jgi:ribosomal protein L40E